MIKPVKPILFAVIILAATVSVAYTLTLYDKIVHGQLYNYGLQFSVEWANPYWTLMRTMQILLAVIAISTVINTIFTVRKYASRKEPSEKVASSQKPAQTVPPITSTAEKKTIPPSLKASTVPAAPSATAVPTEPLSSDIPGLRRCSHCGKTYTQPLRMLDFQGDRPRIVNICPFCNEIMPTAPHQDESDKDKKFQFRKKTNNHTPKPLASQPTS